MRDFLMPRSLGWCAALCIISTVVVLACVVVLVLSDTTWLKWLSAATGVIGLVLSHRWFRRVEQNKYVSIGPPEDKVGTMPID